MRNGQARKFQRKESRKMKASNMREQITETSWPRHKVNLVETRKRDLVIRIADWTRNKDASGYDVEFYQGGVYDWNKSLIAGNL